MRLPDLARHLLHSLAQALAPRPAAPRLTRQRALVLAVSAVPHPGPGVRRWRHADAALVDGSWLCVLRDDRGAYVAEVDDGSGEVRLAFTRTLPVVEPRRRRVPGAYAFVCGRPDGSMTFRPPVDAPLTTLLLHSRISRRRG
ncbi:hypothetical protein [Hamadaea tsunoensis]|uniref:hypothetical protein n=1 Tax=Hamadaea tsunoensis TaxID=53368 RepID=UPI0003FD1089|nr:hypothetical protein [Hamadaea tsunoensis]